LTQPSRCWNICCSRMSRFCCALSGVSSGSLLSAHPHPRPLSRPRAGEGWVLAPWDW
jgi:hypothetical protein